MAASSDDSPRSVDTVTRLLIQLPKGASAVQIELQGGLTTLGSAASADVQVAGVPADWMVVERQKDVLIFREIGGATQHRLAAGERIRIGDVSVSWPLVSDDRGIDVERLNVSLSKAGAAENLLSALVESFMDAFDAECGAFFSVNHKVATLSVIRDRRAQSGALPDPSWLSDSIVSDAIHSGHSVSMAAGTALPQSRGWSVLCSPVRHYGEVVGLLYFAKSEASRYGARAHQELYAIAQLVMPLIYAVRPDEVSPNAYSLGHHPKMLAIENTVSRIGSLPLSVLITGETGTGKEVIARAIHQKSGLKKFVAANCAAIPESLLGSELFGSAKGAFTGADKDRPGLIESAHQGTLFLDEIGDMPKSMQAMLLRVLETRTVQRLGEQHTRPSDFRLLAATHKNLEEEVQKGNFRSDLWFRIKELEIEIPPLSVRGEDIAFLARLFFKQAAMEFKVPEPVISRAAMDALLAHSFPGNVRELKGMVRRAVAVCEGGEVTPTDLFGVRQEVGVALSNASPESGQGMPQTFEPLDVARNQFDQQYVKRALAMTTGNREKAAELLGISIRSLYRLLQEAP